MYEARFSRQPIRAVFDIQGPAEVAAPCADAVDVDVPGRPNTACRRNGTVMAWTGPRQWWLTAPDETAERLLDQFTAIANGHHATVNLLSDQFQFFTLSGREAREVLARGCSLDLHPRNFVVGSCTRTLIGSAEVVLHHVQASPPTYDIAVERSYADYLESWLATGTGSSAITE